MQIAIAQMNTKTADFAPTVERMLAQAKIAAERGADLLLFPFTVLSGPNPGGLTESEEFVSDLIFAIVRYAKESSVPSLVPMVIDTADGVFYEVVLTRSGRATPLVLSTRAVGMFSQGEVESPSEAAISFILNNTRFAVAFSEADLDAFSQGYFDITPDVLVYLSREPYNTDDDFSELAPAVFDGAFVQLASSVNAWLVAVGSVGGYDDLVFAGGSFVMAPWGELAGAAPSFEEDLLVCEIDPHAEGPLKQAIQPPEVQRVELMWEALVTGLRDFVEKSGLEGVLVPITGQLTSAVTVVLAVDALGPQRVHAMMLPVHEAVGTADYCRQLALNLRIGYEDPLSNEMGDRSRALSHQMEAWADDRKTVRRLHKDLANVFLAHRARERKACVVGALDKTAMAVELESTFCAASVIEPLGDVYRTEVAELARWRNLKSPVIPPEMIDNYAVPEDLGVEGASDEIKLSELDAILYLHVERGYGLSAIAGEGFGEEAVGNVLRRVGECAIWRHRMPLVPVMSQRTFLDRGWPVTCGWKDKVRNESQLLEAEDFLRSSLEYSGAAELEVEPTGEVGDDFLRMLGVLPEDDGGSVSGMDEFWKDILG